MDDFKGSLERIRTQFVDAEKVNVSLLKVGDIIYILL